MDKEKLEQLEARIVQLEEEVKQLKGERADIRKTEVKEQVESPVKKVYKPVETKQPHMREKMNIPDYSGKRNFETDWETLIGKVWLPRIFIFVLLLGVVWGFRIAVDAGWLNETNRIIIGFITAGLFYYIGEKQIKKSRIALGKVLLVGSVSTLLVTTFAMHVLYEMIPGSFAFILNIAWVGIGIYLAHVHRSQAMGVMFAVTGYLIPFLVSGNETSAALSIVILYELVYYLALLSFAVRNQYRVLFYVSTIFLHIVYFILMAAGHPALERSHILLMTVGILIQHEVIFYILLKNIIEKLRAFPLLFTSFIFTLIWAKTGFEAYDLAYLFTAYVLLSTIRYGWAAYQAKLKQNRNQLSISTVIATIGIWVLILDVVENQYLMTSLYLIQGALAVYVGYAFKSKVQKFAGYFIYYGTILMILTDLYIYRFEDFVLWGILIGTIYLQVLFSQHEKDEIFFRVNLCAALLLHILFLAGLEYNLLSFGPLYWTAIIASLYVLYRFVHRDMNQLLKRGYAAVNVVLHLNFIAYLASELPLESMNAEVLLTTLGWALYSLSCVYLGMKKQHKPLRLLGIGLILFTLLKLIFFDLVFISLTTRSILFVFIGLIGIIVSRFVYGKNK